MAQQWYKTRDEITGSQHRGRELQPKKFVRMTEIQASAHNKDNEKGKEKLTQAEPTKAEECQFASDWVEWQKEKTETAKTKPVANSKPKK